MPPLNFCVGDLAWKIVMIMPVNEELEDKPLALFPYSKEWGVLLSIPLDSRQQEATATAKSS
jgi:hypothetical protein